MVYFLASNPIIYAKKRLNPANGFVSRLKHHLPSNVNALFVCSDPKDTVFTDQSALDVKEVFEEEGITFENYAVLDSRTAQQTSMLVTAANLIFLAGGHVPTQNDFFQSINLGKCLQNSDKVIIGSSAGSMNAASVVYAQPEEAGEGISKTYNRFLNGLGITDVQLIPHYQETKHHVLDGLRIFEDITYPDSKGRCFYAICDGSYLYGNQTGEKIYGEAYRIQDGILSQISADNDSYQF